MRRGAFGIIEDNFLKACREIVVRRRTVEELQAPISDSVVITIKMFWKPRNTSTDSELLDRRITIRVKNHHGHRGVGTIQVQRDEVLKVQQVAHGSHLVSHVVVRRQPENEILERLEILTKKKLIRIPTELFTIIFTCSR